LALRAPQPALEALAVDSGASRLRSRFAFSRRGDENLPLGTT
jgi:hypothetical protein